MPWTSFSDSSGASTDALDAIKMTDPDDRQQGVEIQDRLKPATSRAILQRGTCRLLAAAELVCLFS
jgi:hypothetical protein